MAVTSISQPTNHKWPAYLDLIVEHDKQLVHRRFVLTTQTQAGRAFKPGEADLWVFPSTGCMRPKDIKMLALRATTSHSWKTERISILAQTKDHGVILVSDSTEQKVLKLGTEIETQSALSSVSHPGCATCQSACIKTLTVILQHSNPEKRRLTVTYAILFSWQRPTRPKDYARFDLPPIHVTSLGITAQSFTISMATPRTRTCMTANSLDYAYIFPVDNGGDYLFQGPSTVPASSIVTATTTDGSKFVLLELRKPETHKGFFLRKLDVKTCTPCSKC